MATTDDNNIQVLCETHWERRSRRGPKSYSNLSWPGNA
jgi:hypothetical protein